MNNLKSTLFELFGDYPLVASEYNYNPTYYYSYHTDKFRVDITDNHGHYLVSVDLRSCFNKTSQSPIHFTFSEYKSLSKRKMKRINEALNFLLRNEKEAGTFLGELVGFDDLGYLTRNEYYASL